MSNALPIIRDRFQDLLDVNWATFADGEVAVWDSATGKFVGTAPSAGVTDHGALTGLADNDHPQYVLAASLGSVSTLSADNVLSWLINLDVLMTPISQVNWNTQQINASRYYNSSLQSSGAQNAEINWDVVLAAGTWTIEVTYSTFNQCGIITAQLDGVSVGTMDTYNAGAVNNLKASIAGIGVATTAKRRLKFLLATKNASSGGYYGIISWVQLRRTA